MADNTDKYVVSITTPADTGGLEDTEKKAQAITPAAEGAAEALDKVAEKTAEIKAPVSSQDWFTEVVTQAGAARREVEGFEAKLRALTSNELEVVKVQFEAARDAAREAGEATSEYENRIASVTAIQQEHAEAIRESSDAINGWFSEVVDQATAARSEVEAFNTKLSSLTADELEVVAQQFREARDAAREADEATDEYDKKIVAVTEAMDQQTLRQMDANEATREAADAQAEASDKAWETANNIGTLSSSVLDATRGAKGFSLIVRSLALFLSGNFSGALSAAIKGVRGLTLAFTALMTSNPFTAILAIAGVALTALLTYFVKVRGEISRVNDEIKKTEEEGLQRMQDRVKAVADESKKLAADSFEKAKLNAQAIADQMQRSLEYSREMQRMADEKENAQMALDLAEVGQRESEEEITASQAVFERAKIRRGYVDAATRRQVSGKQNEIEVNASILQGSGSELEKSKAQLADYIATLRSLREERGRAEVADEMAVNANKSLPKDRQLPDNIASTYDVAISRLAMLISESQEKLDEQQKTHDELARKITRENTLLEDQKRHIQEIAALNKKTETTKVGTEISQKQNQEIANKESAQKKEREGQSMEQSLREVMSPFIDGLKRGSGGVDNHLAKGIDSAIAGLADGDRGGEMETFKAKVVSLLEILQRRGEINKAGQDGILSRLDAIEQRERNNPTR